MIPSFGKILILIGVLFIVVGLLLSFNIRLPWIGKLPGDIVLEKENVKFYFPVATCLLLSLILSALFYFFRR